LVKYHGHSQADDANWNVCAAAKTAKPSTLVTLYFMYYNFGRVHQTHRVTPAMEAGLANHVWSIEEIAGLRR